MTTASTALDGGRQNRRRERRPQLRARLAPHEIFGVALQGLRSRKLRAALSALGIAIGIGAMVAVVGVSSSAQANLLAEIDSLGTNLLKVSAGTDLLGNSPPVPTTATRMVRHMANVNAAAGAFAVDGPTVFRTQYVPVGETGGITVEAADDNLPQVLGTSMASGHFLNRVARRYPEVVLGSAAAANLQIKHVGHHILLDIGNTSFSVIGVMKPAKLDPGLNDEVFISPHMAVKMFGAEPNPDTIYVRARQSDVEGVAGLLAPTTNPQHSSAVAVSRPSNILQTRAEAKGQFTTLLLGLGAVALLVGAIGIANIMVISVLERRGEIGLRRALGATRGHITIQFIAESALLAAIGGITGLLLGAGATELYAAAKHEPFIVPLYALIAAPSAGLLVGTLAGLYPAAKAARLSPTEALRA